MISAYKQKTTGLGELELPKKYTSTGDGQTLNITVSSDGIATPDAAVNNFISVKLVTPLVTSVTPLLVMTFSLGTASGDIELFISNTMLRAANSPPNKGKHQESDSKKVVRCKNFKYSHLERFLWAYLSVLTPPPLSAGCMHDNFSPTTLHKFIVSKVTVTSSGKALVKKKHGTEIMCYLILYCWELTAFP